MSLVVYNNSVIHWTPLSHICDTCLIGELPNLHNLTVQNDSQTNTELNPQDPVATTDVPDQYELFKKKGLHFLHINARSLLPKLTDARLLVQRTNAAVLAVTEIWLDESVTNSEMELNGYIEHRKDRNRKGGGVCLYIRSDIAFNPKPELSTYNIPGVLVCEHSSP